MSYILAIDPGVETGVAVYSTEKKQLIICKTTNFWGAINDIETFNIPGELTVMVELPENKAVYEKKGVKNIDATNNKVAVNVGSVIREAELIIKYLGIHKIPAIIQRPAKRGKILDKEFRIITSWNGRTSQHARDAGMMCFGFNKRNL